MLTSALVVCARLLCHTCIVLPPYICEHHLCVWLLLLLQGLMAYDQYKHRHRYQQEVSQPLDPRTEISRRYRNRVPAI
jgi:hypothetical protein